MSTHASGTIEVKLTPQAPDDNAAGTVIGRILLDKQYSGDLNATSRGQMLAAQTAVAGSAGYVAMEQVTGTLHGRSGTFILQHSGTMAGGDFRLLVTVVPDSGTDELTGLSGEMKGEVVDGKHLYELNYTLAETA